MVQYLADLQ